jgi:hypothetical protein
MISLLFNRVVPASSGGWPRRHWQQWHSNFLLSQRECQCYMYRPVLRCKQRKYMPDFDSTYTLTLDNVNHIQTWNLDWTRQHQHQHPRQHTVFTTRINPGWIIKRVEDKILLPLGGRKESQRSFHLRSSLPNPIELKFIHAVVYRDISSWSNDERQEPSNTGSQQHAKLVLSACALFGQKWKTYCQHFLTCGHKLTQNNPCAHRLLNTRYRTQDPFPTQQAVP